MKLPSLLFTGCLALAGCSAHQQNRTDFEPAQLDGYAEQFPDNDPETVKASRATVGEKVFEKYDDFLMAHVEFDDQGQFWESERVGGRNQLDTLEDHIQSELKSSPAKYAQGAVVVAFVHGWQNNSVEGNANLDNFRNVMAQLAKSEERGRPLIGVFLSWRGRGVEDIPVVTAIPSGLSYFDRKETAQKVGHRAMGETLKRLSFLKDDIVEQGEHREHRDARSRLVLVGHSFGGAAVFSGVSRFFEDELIKVQRSKYHKYVDRNWDLVVLVNPAFEALQYSAINRYSAKIPPVTPSKFVQLPRMLVVGAENDTATGILLPIGEGVGNLFRARQKSEHLDENGQMMTALGHYEPFMTHRLVKSGDTGKLEPFREFENLMGRSGATTMAAYEPNEQQRFLREFAPIFQEDVQVKRVLPFMVVQADSDVVNGHSGIWQSELRNFIVDFINARERAVMALER